MEKCKLCKVNTANKKNSHIISKFLGKELFETKPHKFSIAIGKKGINSKIQDTVKEDYIFCESCEKRMEFIETYFAKKLSEIYNNVEFKNKFDTYIYKGQEYIETKDLHLNAYKLFFYLQAWRISVSKYYYNYKLSIEIEEKLRNFLDINLKKSHKDLMNHIDLCTEDPDLLTCLIIPKEINKNTKGIYTAYKFDDESFILLAVHFAFMLFTDIEKVNDIYKLFGNNKNERIKIVLGNNDSWEGLNKEILKKLINPPTPF